MMVHVYEYTRYAYIYIYILSKCTPEPGALQSHSSPRIVLHIGFVVVCFAVVVVVCFVWFNAVCCAMFSILFEMCSKYFTCAPAGLALHYSRFLSVVYTYI